MEVITMFGFPSEETVKSLREQYPKGTRIALNYMNDPYSKLEYDDRGTVDHVDDAGTNGKFRIMLSKIRTPPFSLCNQ